MTTDSTGDRCTDRRDDPGGARVQIDGAVRRIRILLVDDHPVVRYGLRLVLGTEKDLEIVGEARNGADGCEQAARLAPDIVLLDLDMGDTSGIESLPHLRAAAPGTRVIVYSAHASASVVRETVQAGIDGYVRKDAPPHRLVEAIRSVWHGRSFLDPAVVDIVFGSIGVQEPVQAAEEALTAREQQVLKLIACGLPNKRIARDLGITERTVKFHVSTTLRKLGVNNRTEAARAAVDRGLV